MDDEPYGPVITYDQYLSILNIRPYTGFIFFIVDAWYFKVSNILHNEFGPAVGYNETYYWYLNEKNVSKREHTKRTTKLGRVLYDEV